MKNSPTVILTCAGLVMIWVAACFSNANTSPCTSPFAVAAGLTAVIMFIAALMNAKSAYEDDDDCGGY